MRLFLAGDVMTGRGIDQVLSHPCPPEIYEPYMTSALDYVALAERAAGPIPRPVEPAYIWGEARAALDRAAPDLRIVNLETSVTRRGVPEPKGINYRVSPENLPCLGAARIDCCVLANNHVLDWGPEGLSDTLAELDRAGLAVAGAGTRGRAEAPAVLETEEGRLLVFAIGCPSSGIPPNWAAARDAPGVALMDTGDRDAADRLAGRIAEHRRPGDRVVVSVHWGGNWGHEIPDEQTAFAHRLIDRGAADLVHGHSSHHPKAVGCHAGRAILYGCGDFVNDYEGIGGHERYRPDLTLAYLPTLADDGTLAAFDILVFRIARFRLTGPADADIAWMADMLDRRSRPFGARIERAGGNLLRVRSAWATPA